MFGGGGGGVDLKEIMGAKLTLHYNFTSPKDDLHTNQLTRVAFERNKAIHQHPPTCNNRHKKCSSMTTKLTPNLEKEEKRG